MNNQSHAAQVTREGMFALNCHADRAFPLFSPEGEQIWVPGWDATPVFPADRMPLEPDTVFTTSELHGPATWVIASTDARARRTEYVAFEPRTHCGHITVQVEALEEGHCRVHARYVITAFGEHREEMLRRFDEGPFRERMTNWKEWIERTLRR